MVIIDARGKPCPIPVIEAKKAMEKNNAVKILVDNEVAVQNLSKMAAGKKYEISFKKNADFFEVSLQCTIMLQDSQPCDCEIIQESASSQISKKSSGNAVLISQNAMGHGSIDLGKILIKGFIYSLSEQKQLPASIIFINSGVLLTTKDSNVSEDVCTLEKLGVAVYICGTCANYYNIQNNICAGSIVDMYFITDTLLNAEKVITI